MKEKKDVEVYVKVHHHGKDVVVAICDVNLIGKTFTDGPLRIEVSEEFYGGEKVNIQEAMNIAKKATIANFLGEEAVKHAIKRKLVHKDCVIEVASIPHAQLIKIV
ncbi:MAG: DUF424 family protein [Candidatus Nezhaarchaeota archaeon]|nr:DUF424 family protein [Candidatus Nezhaarchaeota archaeon]